MYNDISEELYSKYRQKFYKNISGLEFKNKTNSLAQTSFDIMKQNLKHFADDYSVFLSHYEKFKGEKNALDSVHLAENVMKNFNSFWDYLGFYLNLIYKLGINFEKVCFKKAIGKINLTSKGTKLRKFSIKLENIYDKDKKVRDYRNQSIHRSKLAYLRNENETTDDILNNLKKELKESYDRIIRALKIYFKIINECEPIIEIKVR